MEKGLVNASIEAYDLTGKLKDAQAIAFAMNAAALNQDGPAGDLTNYWSMTKQLSELLNKSAERLEAITEIIDLAIEETKTVKSA